MEKTRNKKKQKVQTHVPCQASPQTLSMGLIFFVCFSIVFWHVFHIKMLSSQYLSKNARFYNLHTCAPQAKLQKKTWEKQLKTKSSDPCPLSNLSSDPVHGSDFFVFFLVFSRFVF